MSDESLARCGRIINPPALKIRSTEADEAGTQNAWLASFNNAGNSLLFFCQKSKMFEGPAVMVATSLKYFVSCDLGLAV